MNNLNSLTIKEAKKGLKEKRYSSVDLVNACLSQINKWNKQLNSFITVSDEYALDRAKKADLLISEGKTLPLLGIPLAVKDLFSTKGIKTTAASKVLDNYVPVYSSTVIEKLETAGAVILGKTNCDAWAHGSSGENSDFGPSRNPWDLTKTPGGSSSGSAVSVASDMCLFATGTDTGGSIRLPASFTATVGIKPTYGRVSRYGILAMASSLDSIGHFTKTVYDSALILGVTAGQDRKDANTHASIVPDYVSDIDKINKKIKIGIPKEYFSEGLDSEVRSAVNKALEIFKAKGMEVSEISLPHTKEGVAVYYIIMSSEVSSNLARYDGIRFGNPRNFFGDEAKRRIMLGTFTLSSGYYDAYYLTATKVRTLIKQDFEDSFKNIDVILAPVSPVPAFNLGEKINNPLSMYLADVLTIPVSLAGLPSLSLNCGFSRSGLPIGMQIIGSQLREDLLFQLGNLYQNNSDWHLKKPKLI